MHEIAIGIITAWSGGLGNIPTGWHLCDGSSGTPDLRDNFVPGAGALFAVGNEGGSVSHTHGFISNDHSHLIVAGTDIASSPATFIELSEETALGTTDSQSSLPTYWALAYIQFLGV